MRNLYIQTSELTSELAMKSILGYVCPLKNGGYEHLLKTKWMGKGMLEIIQLGP